MYESSAPTSPPSADHSKYGTDCTAQPIAAKCRRFIWVPPVSTVKTDCRLGDPPAADRWRKQ